MNDKWIVSAPWTKEQGPINISLGSQIRDDFKITKHDTEFGMTNVLDLQHNTGQIFKQHVEVAHCNSRKGKDSLTMNAAVADYTRLQYIQKLPV